MWAGAAAFLVLLISEQASAHGGGARIGPEEAWQYWAAEPWIIVSLLALLGLYGRGVWRIWARAGRGRGISAARAACFAAGWLALAAALASPLDALSETLLTAHMIQHALLIAIAPPLLLAGWPGAALPWSLPQRVRRTLGRSAGLRTFARRLAFLVRPLPAATLHGVVLWIWHAPSLFEAALGHEGLHIAEHVAFFGTAMLFWQSLVTAARSTATVPAGIAAGFLTLLHGGFLSALITFAPRPLYSWYQEAPDLWGLDPLADQQLAGLIMGVPLTFIYLLACLVLVARFLTPTRPYRGGEHGFPA